MTNTTTPHPATPTEAQRPIEAPAGPAAADRVSFTECGVAALAARREHAASIWLMTRGERVGAYLRGELTHEQIQEWIARAPREPPRINGEFAHIAATTPEACMPCPVCGDDEVALTTGGMLARHTDHRHPATESPSARGHRTVPDCPGSGTRSTGPKARRT